MSSSPNDTDHRTDTRPPAPSRLGLPRRRQIPAPVHRAPPAATPVTLPRTQAHLAAGIVMHRAGDVRCLAQFQQVMGGRSTAVESVDSVGTVQGLPLHLRAAPLAALGGRIMAMPGHERPAAIRAFLACDPGVACHDVLVGLRAAACLGPAGLRSRELTLVGPRGAAHAAVAMGDSVPAVAHRFAISSTPALEALERVAMPIAHRARAVGASLPMPACGRTMPWPARVGRFEHGAQGPSRAPVARKG